MKVAVIYNKEEIKDSDVINVFGMPTKERYKPQTIEMVASALEAGGHNVRLIEGNMHVIDELQNFMPRVVRGERPGMVFNMAYGIQGQYRYTHIPAMLEMLGIPYVGSGPAVHAIALDKVMSKIVFLRHNLPTPNFWVFSTPKDDVSKVKYPVIVKPKMEAVSLGLRVVHNESDLKEAIDFIVREFQQQALVEEFIPGSEFAVPLLGNGSNLETLPIVEIDLSSDPNAIQSVDDKMQHPRGKICPAKISPELENELCKLSRGVFNALGVLDFSRVDFRMAQDGKFYILEINSMASLNPTGSFVHSAEVAGMDFTALVNRILDIAAVRYFGKSILNAAPQEINTTKKHEPLHVKVRGYMRGHLSTLVDYIEQMVTINSCVHNIEGVNTLSNWISNRFQQLGFQRQIFPQVEVGNIIYFTNHIAERNDILLLGHLDTVYDYQNYVPFYEERGRLYGSGVAESKGGIAVAIAALQALRYARVIKNLRCGVLFTTDDSLGGRFSQKLIAEIGNNSKYVVGLKYGDISGGIVTSCSGAQQYQVEISNIKNHRNKIIPDVIANISQKLNLWQKLNNPDEGINVTVNTLQAQTNPGRSSDHATVTLTVRFSNKSQSTELEEQIREIAEKGTNGLLQVQVRVGQRRLPVAETKVNMNFFEKVGKIAEMLEVRIQPVHREISSDICHIPESVPVLGGFGPIGNDAQSPNEYIVRDSLIDRAALLALVIHNCGK
ncbi:MAG TPA: M20/M25/M40 family metallo-hydrolase [bacterium]